MVFCHESMPLKLQEVDVHIFHSGGARTCTAKVSISGAPSHTIATVQAHDSLSSQPWLEAVQGQQWWIVLAPCLSILPKCKHTSEAAAASLNAHHMGLIPGADDVSDISIAQSTSATAEKSEVGDDIHSFVRLAGSL